MVSVNANEPLVGFKGKESKSTQTRSPRIKSRDEGDKFERKGASIKEKGDKINRNLSDLNDSLKKANGTVGNLIISITGLCTCVTKPFQGIIDWAKKPETKKLINSKKRKFNNFKKDVGKGIKEHSPKVLEFIKNHKKGIFITAAVVAAALFAKSVIKMVMNKKAEIAEIQAEQNEVPETESEHKLDIVSEADEDYGDDEE